MVLASHLTGNRYVHEAVLACAEAGLLCEFWTGLAPNASALGRVLRRLPGMEELTRRDVPDAVVPFTRQHPLRESLRLIAGRLGLRGLLTSESGFASLDAVFSEFDQYVGGRLGGLSRYVKGVYCVEDGAYSTFQAASALGMRRIYDLPIAYWATALRLLQQEAQRWPQWEPTLGATRHSEAKVQRKTNELALAEFVLCPSRFVMESLPEDARINKTCVVAEFGSPAVLLPARARRSPTPLRILFAGSMTQRKGLADVFAAVKSLARSDVELVVMGSTVATMDFYRAEYKDFRYEPPRPHSAVLELMRSCDVLILPSIVEGRALVQQEALSCGLPLIVTRNAGAEELVEEGRTGFLVPIRSPDALAEKISWFADHRDALPEMSLLAVAKAQQFTWASYREKIAAVVADALT